MYTLCLLTFWLTNTDACRANVMLRLLRRMRRRAAIQPVFNNKFACLFNLQNDDNYEKLQRNQIFSIQFKFNNSFVHIHIYDVLSTLGG